MSQDLMIPQDAPAYLVEDMQQNKGHVNALASGIQSSFKSISIRGSKWRIRQGDEEVAIVDPTNQLPVQFIEVTLLAANTHLSKTFYAQKFQEGTHASPDCASANGVHPDAGVATPVASYCQTCPKNQWGSAISESSGKQIKACQDSKRLAVVAGTIFDTVYLLNVPATSLQALRSYADALNSRNRPFYGVVTRLMFDPNTSHPQLIFKYVRDLTAAEYAAAKEKLQDPIIDSITGEFKDSNVPVAAPAAPVQQPVATPAPVQQPAAGFGTPAPVQQPTAAAEPAATVPGFGTPAPAQQPVATPAPEQPVAGFGTPAPVQQPVAPAAESGVELDIDGVAWNEELHAGTKTKTADGRWKKKRGAGKTSPAPAAQTTASQQSPAPAATGFGTPAAAAPAQPVATAPAPTIAGLDDLDASLDGLGF